MYEGAPSGVAVNSLSAGQQVDALSLAQALLPALRDERQFSGMMKPMNPGHGMSMTLLVSVAPLADIGTAPGSGPSAADAGAARPLWLT